MILDIPSYTLLNSLRVVRRHVGSGVQTKAIDIKFLQRLGVPGRWVVAIYINMGVS